MALAPLAFAIPLIAAAALAAARPLISHRASDVVAIAVAAAVAVLCGLLVARARDGTVVAWLGGWRPRGEVAVGIAFAVDTIGAAMACFTALLAVGALVFAIRYIEATDDLFRVLMLVFLAAMVGFALAGDLFTLFVCFELMSVAAFVLAGYQIEQRAPLEGSLNFAITNTVGSFFLLIGIGLIYGRTGALNLAQLGHVLSGRPADALVAVAFALVASGFLVKAAVVPFHFWLADAYAVARTPVCILFAGAMSELGLYGVARVYWTAFSGALGSHEAELRAILVGAGLLTAALGAAMALLQTHLKRLLAFVTISYVGLFLVGLGLLNAEGLAGAALYVAGDGFVKGALFVCVGIVQHRRAHVDTRPLHGRGRDLPFTAALFALGALAVASLPPFGAFLGKSLVEHGAVKVGYGWVVPLFILVSAVTGAAILRAGGRVFLGLGSPERPAPSDEAGEEPEPPGERERTPATMFVPALALLSSGLAVGLWPGLPDSAMRAAARFLDSSGYGAAVLAGHAAGPVGAPPAATPAWYDFAFGALSALGAVGLAALLLRDRAPRPAALRRGGPAVRGAAEALRRAHSGHPGDYVAFLVAGIAVFGGLFAATLT